MNNQEFLDKLKVINDHTRLTIVQMLAKRGTLCACKILEELNITQATLSHHMKVLTDSGLVSFIRHGKWCYYTIVKSKFVEIGKFISEIGENANIKLAEFCDC